MSERFTPSESFVTRHSIQPNRKAGEKSAEQYFGISEAGVELAKKRARGMLESIKQAEEGTVLAFIGASEADRTKATIRIYGDELARLVDDEGNEDIQVLTQDDIDSEARMAQNIQHFADIINSNPKKKFVIATPLYLKELKLQDRWQNPNGHWASEYSKKIFEDNNYDNQAVLEEWLKNQGRLEGLVGPNPKTVAEEELAGLTRIKEFVAKFVPNRPIQTGFVGHTPNIEALAIYLANDGRVDTEGFEKIGGKSFSESEMIEIKKDCVVLPSGKFKL